MKPTRTQTLMAVPLVQSPETIRASEPIKPTERAEHMTPKLRNYGLSLLTAGAVLFGAIALAPAADKESDDASFKKYGQVFKGKIGRTYEESVEWYPEGVKPKPGTPNVFMILLDDVGYSQIGCYGGLIETPNIHA